MNILICNDDGYLAPGIKALATELRSIANVVVVAPDRNRSGASSSLSLTHPINTSKHADDLFSVEGTPADCINVALGGLIDMQPDMVVSGINDGPNMADDVLYSGTIAAALEGRFLGLPSVAVSMGSFHAEHFQSAAKITRNLVEKMLVTPLPQNTILNVNVPDLPLQAIEGIESTRLGSRLPPTYAAAHSNPALKNSKQTLYWLGPAGDQNDNGLGTDFSAINNNKVSVTPLTIDMTKHESLKVMSNWLLDTVELLK